MRTTTMDTPALQPPQFISLALGYMFTVVLKVDQALLSIPVHPPVQFTPSLPFSSIPVHSS
jgi:hypothetical protein